MKNNKKSLKKFVTQSLRPPMKPTEDKEVLLEEKMVMIIMTMMISIMRICDQ